MGLFRKSSRECEKKLICNEANNEPNMLLRRKRKQRRVRLSGVCTALLLILMGLVIVIDTALRAPLREIALEKVNHIAAEVLNDAVLTVMRGLDGSENELTRLEEDEDGVSMLFIDANRLNLIAAEIEHEAQLGMKNASAVQITIPLGTASGISAFTGAGPSVEVEFDPEGSVTSSFSSRFSGAGINQTRYCAYICLTAKVRLIVGNYEDTITVDHTAALCEAIIIGEVPSAYTNVSSVDEALNLIPTDPE